MEELCGIIKGKLGHAKIMCPQTSILSSYELQSWLHILTKLLKTCQQKCGLSAKQRESEVKNRVFNLWPVHLEMLAHCIECGECQNTDCQASCPDLLPNWQSCVYHVPGGVGAACWGPQSHCVEPASRETGTSSLSKFKKQKESWF